MNVSSLIRPPLDTPLVKRAIEFAKENFTGGQLKKMGSIVRRILLCSPDEKTLVSGILAVSIEKENPPYHEIEAIFGKDICTILLSLEKLDILSTVSIEQPENRAEILRKMFLALAKDIRVVIIKIAVHIQALDDFQTLPKKKRDELAKEALNLFSPIASRIGIYQFKRELEDKAFAYLYPEEYHQIAKEIRSLAAHRKKVLEKGKEDLIALLRDARIEGEVQGRMKEPYSIYQKMRNLQKNILSDIYDIFAFRVLVPKISDCYTVLGLIHEKWKVLTSRFKDYIAMPKPNGYKSIHTTIFESLGGSEEMFPMEIQIRTKEMHLEAEFGSAVHWSYKEGNEEMPVENWFSEIAQASKDLKSAESFEIFAKDFLGDRIFVLTEKGDVKILPEDATPVDFAYAVHSDIGDHCQGAMVNEKIVPLHYKLQNGDVVKIITSKLSSPRDSWLSLAVSSAAKQRIRQYLKKHDQEYFLREGKKTFNESLRKLNAKPLDGTLSILRDAGAKRELSLREREDILKRIGNGSLKAHVIARKVIIPYKKEKRDIANRGSLSNGDDTGVIISGESGYEWKKAKCCNPAPRDRIIAYTTRGGKFTVHHRKCRTIKNLDIQRLLGARWETSDPPEFGHFLIRGFLRRTELVKRITECCLKNGVSLIEAAPSETFEKNVLSVVVEASSREDREEFTKELASLNGVEEMTEINED